ncbi:MAG TPA: FxsA family protein [Actinobacteria bacterium]|nr:FxsA family protein [Actinomycetota bacterium]
MDVPCAFGGGLPASVNFHRPDRARSAAPARLFYNDPVFFKLLLIFIVAPLLELMVIIEVSSRIGLAWTFLSLLFISITGAALAKREGYSAVARIRADVNEGVMPSDSLIDGALVLAAALMLLTPGYITDTAGLLLLLPPVRRPLRAWVRQRIARAIDKRTVRFYTSGDAGGEPPGGGDDESERRRRELT